MSSTVNIREKDIKSAILESGGYSIIYTKESYQSPIYNIRYSYSGPIKHMVYCEECGEFYDPKDNSKCPYTHSHETEISDNIPNIIYDSLADGVTVFVELWDDTKYHFYLPED